MCGKWNSQTLLVERYNCAETLENSLVVPQDVKQNYHLNPQIHSLKDS